MKLRKDESLQLAGWSFEPSRTLAKLRQTDKPMTYIDVKQLVHAPELLGALNHPDQNKVREMALQAAA